MSEKILVPVLGESITEATVAKWLKNKGDSIETDEPLVELETDKVNLEVPSPVDGILSEINANNGQVVEVGAILGLVTQNGEVKKTKKEIVQPKKKIEIGLIGKYIELKDSYKSISEALIHAGTIHDCAVEIKWIHAENIESKNVKKELRDLDGVLVSTKEYHFKALNFALPKKYQIKLTYTIQKNLLDLGEQTRTDEYGNEMYTFHSTMKSN